RLSKPSLTQSPSGPFPARHVASRRLRRGATFYAVRKSEAVVDSDATLERALDAAAHAMSAAEFVVVFTGAGVSAQAGMPTFRSGANALWANADIEQFANPRGYRRRSSDAWRWYAKRAQVAHEAQPNAAHYAIAEIERRVPDFLLVTQNIDGLHHRAG